MVRFGSVALDGETFGGVLDGETEVEGFGCRASLKDVVVA